MQQQQPRRRPRRATFDGLVDDHASRLVRAPISALPGGIASALEAVGRRIGADCLTLSEVRRGEPRLATLHCWSRPGCGLPAGDLSGVDLPWLMAQVDAGRPVAFRSSADLPPEASRERRFLSRNGPRSAAILPLVVGDAAEGVLLVGKVRSERSWGGPTLARLERAAVVLASALLRKRAHDAALATESRLGGVIEAGPYGVLLVRPSGRVERANGKAAAIFLRTRPELGSERLQDLLAPAPDDPPRRGGGTLDLLLSSRGPLRMLARRGDGSTVPVEVALREATSPGDDLFCCGIAEVSEDRRARDEAARIRDEIVVKGRTAMLAEMGSGIAHELNQPLTAILSNAEAAQRLLGRSRAADTAELRETLQDVVNDTRRAADILGRMRDMIRSRHAEQVPVDVGELMEGVARHFREEALTRTVRLSVDVGPGLPAVLGDPVQLEQVMMNLVLNAFEALGERAGRARAVAIRARPAASGGVDLAVRDSGPGLDDQALAHAFDPFFSTKPRGLGVGLAISRSIVEAHGGRLLARNNAEGGATFEFNLPRAAPEGAPERTRKPA